MAISSEIRPEKFAMLLNTFTKLERSLSDDTQESSVVAKMVSHQFLTERYC